MLNANGLEVVKSGEVVRFISGVTMDLTPGDNDAGGQPAEKP